MFVLIDVALTLELQRFDTVRQSPSTGQNGHAAVDVFASRPFPSEPHAPVERVLSPAVGDYSVAEEHVLIHEEQHYPPPVPMHIDIKPPRTPSPHYRAPPPPLQPQASYEELEEVRHQLAFANAEIARLRDLLSAVPETTSNVSEVRRRRRVSDDGTVLSSVAETDLGTMMEHSSLPQMEGIPPHIVVAISAAVFVLTYIFF